MSFTIYLWGKVDLVTKKLKKLLTKCYILTLHLQLIQDSSGKFIDFPSFILIPLNSQP